MFAHTFADGLLELGGLEERRAVWDAGEGLVGFEDATGHAHVDFLAGLEIEAEPPQHEGDQTAGAGADDEVKVVAGFGNLIATRGLAFAFDIDAVHEFLEDDKHGVAADTAAI